MNITKDEKLIEARIRQANADAALKELRYKEKSEELVSRKAIDAEYQREWKETVLKVRTKIIGVEALAPQLVGLSARGIASVLKRWSRDTLNELAAEF